MRRMSYIVIETHIHIEVLIPIRVQGLFNDTSGVCLFSIHSDDCEWVWKPEYITLGEAIRSDN